MGQFEDQCQMLFPKYQGKDAGTYQCCVDSITPELMQNGVRQQKRHIQAVCSRIAQENKLLDASRVSWCTGLYPKHVDCCKVNLTDDALHAAIAVSKSDDPTLGTVPVGMDAEVWVKLTGKESPEEKRQKQNRKEKMDTVAKAQENINKKCKMNIYLKRSADAGIVAGAGILVDKVAVPLGKAIGESTVKAPGELAKKGYRAGKYIKDAFSKSGKGGEGGEAGAEGGATAGAEGGAEGGAAAGAEGGEAVAQTTETVATVADVAETTETVATVADVAETTAVVTEVAEGAAVGGAAVDGAAAAGATAAGLFAAAGVSAATGIGIFAAVGLVGVGAVYGIKSLEDD